MAFNLPQRLMPQQPDTSQFMQMLGGQQPPGLMGNVNPSAMHLAQFLMNDPGQIPAMGTGMPFGLPMMIPGMQAAQPRAPVPEAATRGGQQPAPAPATRQKQPPRRYFSER